MDKPLAAPAADPVRAFPAGVESTRLGSLVPTVPRPVVLLETGGERPGRYHLAWGHRHHLCVAWSDRARALDRLGQALSSDPLYGAIAYEAGLEAETPDRRPAIAQPALEMFVPENLIVVDEVRGTVACTGPTAEAVWTAANGSTETGPGAVGPVQSSIVRSLPKADFIRAAVRTREYIEAGDVYQVNVSVAERFRSPTNAWDAYRRLRKSNPSPWMGYADFGRWQLVSSSPELLVEVTPEGRVRTRPIAGTRKKTGDPVRDDAMRTELTLDEKERAEHVMLVDLERNDIGRIATPGTVRVIEREVVEEYSHVFHLVSEVEGRVAADRSVLDAVRALFPGGTITGCPKYRATEIIGELEPVARGMYTGALGWVSTEAAQLNIVIRSAVVRGTEVVVQQGAGIVWDSVPEREWRESLRKGAAVRAAFGLPA